MVNYLTDLPLAREDDDALLCALVRVIDRVSDETAAALGSDVVLCMINPRIPIPWNNEADGQRTGVGFKNGYRLCDTIVVTTLAASVSRTVQPWQPGPGAASGRMTSPKLLNAQALEFAQCQLRT